MRIDLGPARQLHDELQQAIKGRSGELTAEIRRANATLRARGISFGGEKEMAVACSALLLRPADVARLNEAAQMMDGILERLIDWILASPDRARRYAPDHARILPYVKKTRGSDRWQLFSRYDAAVTSSGSIRFIEANTGCPAGFMHAVDFTEETQRILSALNVPSLRAITDLGMIRPGALVEMLLTVESHSAIEPGLTAILTDENQLKLELDLIERSIRDRGRDAMIIDARSLSWRDNTLFHEDRRISTTFNKLRISTPQSPNHCWKEGFEERYASFLSAINASAIATVNNLGALTVAEDKGMFAHLFDPVVREIFSPSERDWIDETVAWTSRVERKKYTRAGQTRDLIEHLRDRKDDFIIKPSNEGRGFGVHVGRETSQDEWTKLCEPDASFPRVVQEFWEPASFSVPCLRGDEIKQEPMFITIALAMLNGEYSGMLSRISPNVVTNVGRQGFVQAVFVADPNEPS